MKIPERTIGGVTYSGPVAEAASKITDEEWAYYSLFDKLTDLIAEFMDESGVNKADLARQLGTSRAFISKVLSGDAHNMTIKTLSRVIFHLNAKLEVNIVSKNDFCRWLGVVTNEKWRGQQLHPWAIKKGGQHVCGQDLSTEGLSEKEPVAA